jgi:phosphopantothenoylcysteine decarboxylase/phosphopantothenate--cysteine ligase
MKLRGRKILIGITASISAYKICTLVRLLKKAEAEVKLVMSPSASAFVSPLTLATLSQEPVLSAFEKNAEGEWNNHVELGLWPDLILVAPASANTIGKLANGLCDNLLMAVLLSARCPVWLAPAMDLDMWTHKSNARNMATLISDGFHILEPAEGPLASGLSGKGRLQEPEEIFAAIQGFFNKEQRFLNKRILITNGPTHEPLDPVRFIGNNASGKMGFAIAEAFAKEGALVTVICGPVPVVPVLAGVDCVPVKTALEMQAALTQRQAEADVLVFAAAVADYAPVTVAEQKIKKQEEDFTITLKKNPDIALEAGKRKAAHQFHVGFALETEREAEYARDKMLRKSFDLMVMNSLRDAGAGFAGDTNKVTFFTPDGHEVPMPLKSKKEVAQDIVDYVFSLHHA